MNIFYLDEDVMKISRMLCDKHSIKMVLESAQMMSTAHRTLDGDEYANRVGLYQTVHKNHPSTIWTRTTSGNYAWHFALFSAMLAEYQFRYEKLHKCKVLLTLLEQEPQNIPRGDFSPPPQCMPKKYKSDNTVRAYRNFYVGEKARFASWKNRAVPDWFSKAGKSDI